MTAFKVYGTSNNSPAFWSWLPLEDYQKATQDCHAPDQVPAHFSDFFNSSYTAPFGVYNGMAAAADELFGNMTAALKARSMYDVSGCPPLSLYSRLNGRWTKCLKHYYLTSQNTLIIMSSDNGGPASVYASSHCANNWPL